MNWIKKYPLIFISLLVSTFCWTSTIVLGENRVGTWLPDNSSVNVAGNICSSELLEYDGANLFPSPLILEYDNPNYGWSETLGYYKTIDDDLWHFTFEVSYLEFFFVPTSINIDNMYDLWEEYNFLPENGDILVDITEDVSEEVAYAKYSYHNEDFFGGNMVHIWGYVLYPIGDQVVQIEYSNIEFVGMISEFDGVAFTDHLISNISLDTLLKYDIPNIGLEIFYFIIPVIVIAMFLTITIRKWKH